ncbi:hypothetical protein MJO29_016353 [Puccinia striiformis f. sp. tritici]|nr:hypothetical protein Pst134EB_031137 [Puccinia striiformis f. sp. tritici]KAI7935090.1 hypothetical protein MJO29_016353 [Puccinia striiformis f. sp. tritici]KAI9601961.1 hypothetical protein KEM48_001250 [Puccinia striiformis f. sp. tritici PST-130]
MVEEAPPCQPPRNEDMEQPSPKTEGISLMKKFKAKIRTVTNDHVKLSPNENTSPKGIEQDLPSRARKTVDRFCQAHGFSNPLKDNPTSPGKQHSDDTMEN